MHPDQHAKLKGQHDQSVAPAAPARRSRRSWSTRCVRSGCDSSIGDDSSDDHEPSSRWLRTRPAARYLGVGFSTLNKLRLTGGGPKYAKLGAVVVYNIADLDRWVEERMVRSTSEPVRAA